MIIRPQEVETQSDIRRESSIIRKFKNEIYMSPIDRDESPFGSVMYDIVLISEIIGDVPGEVQDIGSGKIMDPGMMFGKIVHYFSGVVNKEFITTPESTFSHMALHPTISYATSFRDMFVGYGVTQFYKHDKSVLSKVYFKDARKAPLTASNYVEEMEKFRIGSKHCVALDIPDPLHPALYRYYDGDVPRLTKIGRHQYTGSEFGVLPDLKVNNVQIDFAKEEKARVDRNRTIRALLGTNADSSESDPLVDRIKLGNIASNIAVDFMEADVFGMEESCTLIFDNKHPQAKLAQTELYCGFKSLVSPFGQLFPLFDEVKSSFVALTFDKICKVALGVCTSRHYRVTLESNPYEVTVKASILDETPIDPALNPYDFKKSVTIKMKKSALLDDFITQHMYSQTVKHVQ